MQRYFNNNIVDHHFVLNNDDSYHIERVMRMQLNDVIEVVCNQKLYHCAIKSFNPVKCEVLEEINENHELNKKVIIVQSLVNEQKMDLILQKGTELGMSELYPFAATNSVVKANKDFDKKINRWQKIVKEASEQSKRDIIPKVNNIIKLNDLINIKADLKLLCTVNEMTKSIKNILQDNYSCDTIVIVIGPEGGFTISEEDLLIKNQFIPVSLGSRVLRTETASLAVLSMINYEWMV